MTALCICSCFFEGGSSALRLPALSGRFDFFRLFAGVRCPYRSTMASAIDVSGSRPDDDSVGAVASMVSISALCPALAAFTASWSRPL